MGGEFGELGGADQDRQAGVGGHQGGGGGEDLVEFFYGSEGDYIGSGEFGAGGQGLGALGDYIDVGQCKRSGHFAQERHFLVV